VGVVVVSLALGALGTAGADAGVEKLRSTGMAAYDAGKYAEAKQAFDEAFRLAPLHSLGVWAARSRVKLGELVEADAQYEKLQKAPVTRGEGTTEEQARQQAVREREELRHRIPRLRIRLEGVEPSAVDVTIDGAPVGDEFLFAKNAGLFPRGKSLEVNPGQHVILGVSGEQRREMPVTLGEGETREVRLRFVNPDTVRQRKCADACRADCDGNNKCYVECKHRCFTKKG
jgi:tetratricopeptide (TPR) repeat protein